MNKPKDKFFGQNSFSDFSNLFKPSTNARKSSGIFLNSKFDIYKLRKYRCGDFLYYKQFGIWFVILYVSRNNVKRCKNLLADTNDISDTQDQIHDDQDNAFLEDEIPVTRQQKSLLKEGRA